MKMCSPRADLIEETSRMSSLDLYEDLLVKDNQESDRLLTMQEVVSEKQSLAEQNKLLLQQLVESTQQAKKFQDEKQNLEKNFQSLLATAKIEIERKNRLLAHYMGGSQTSAVHNRPVHNRQNVRKTGTEKPKKQSFSLKGRRIDDEELKMRSSTTIFNKKSTSERKIEERRFVRKDSEKTLEHNERLQQTFQRENEMGKGRYFEHLHDGGYLKGEGLHKRNQLKPNPLKFDGNKNGVIFEREERLFETEPQSKSNEIDKSKSKNMIPLIREAHVQEGLSNAASGESPRRSERLKDEKHIKGKFDLRVKLNIKKKSPEIEKMKNFKNPNLTELVGDVNNIEQKKVESSETVEDLTSKNPQKVGETPNYDLIKSNIRSELTSQHGEKRRELGKRASSMIKVEVQRPKMSAKRPQVDQNISSEERKLKNSEKEGDTVAVHRQVEHDQVTEKNKSKTNDKENQELVEVRHQVVHEERHQVVSEQLNQHHSISEPKTLEQHCSESKENDQLVDKVDNICEEQEEELDYNENSPINDLEKSEGRSKFIYSGNMREEQKSGPQMPSSVDLEPGQGHTLPKPEYPDLEQGHTGQNSCRKRKTSRGEEQIQFSKRVKHIGIEKNLKSEDKRIDSSISSVKNIKSEVKNPKFESPIKTSKDRKSVALRQSPRIKQRKVTSTKSAEKKKRSSKSKKKNKNKDKDNALIEVDKTTRTENSKQLTDNKIEKQGNISHLSGEPEIVDKTSINELPCKTKLKTMNCTMSPKLDSKQPCPETPVTTAMMDVAMEVVIETSPTTSEGHLNDQIQKDNLVTPVSGSLLKFGEEIMGFEEEVKNLDPSPELNSWLSSAKKKKKGSGHSRHGNVVSMTIVKTKKKKKQKLDKVKPNPKPGPNVIVQAVKMKSGGAVACQKIGGARSYPQTGGAEASEEVSVGKSDTNRRTSGAATCQKTGGAVVCQQAGGAAAFGEVSVTRLNTDFQTCGAATHQKNGGAVTCQQTGGAVVCQQAGGAVACQQAGGAVTCQQTGGAVDSIERINHGTSGFTMKPSDKMISEFPFSDLNISSNRNNKSSKETKSNGNKTKFENSKIPVETPVSSIYVQTVENKKSTISSTKSAMSSSNETTVSSHSNTLAQTEQILFSNARASEQTSKASYSHSKCQISTNMKEKSEISNFIKMQKKDSKLQKCLKDVQMKRNPSSTPDECEIVDEFSTPVEDVLSHTQHENGDRVNENHVEVVQAFSKSTPVEENEDLSFLDPQVSSYFQPSIFPQTCQLGKGENVMRAYKNAALQCLIHLARGRRKEFKANQHILHPCNAKPLDLSTKKSRPSIENPLKKEFNPTVVKNLFPPQESHPNEILSYPSSKGFTPCQSSVSTSPNTLECSSGELSMSSRSFKNIEVNDFEIRSQINDDKALFREDPQSPRSFESRHFDENEKKTEVRKCIPQERMQKNFENITQRNSRSFRGHKNDVTDSRHEQHGRGHHQNSLEGHPEKSKVKKQNHDNRRMRHESNIRSNKYSSRSNEIFEGQKIENEGRSKWREKQKKVTNNERKREIVKGGRSCRTSSDLSGLMSYDESANRGGKSDLQKPQSRGFSESRERRLDEQRASSRDRVHKRLLTTSSDHRRHSLKSSACDRSKSTEKRIPTLRESCRSKSRSSSRKRTSVARESRAEHQGRGLREYERKLDNRKHSQSREQKCSSRRSLDESRGTIPSRKHESRSSSNSAAKSYQEKLSHRNRDTVHGFEENNTKYIRKQTKNIDVGDLSRNGRGSSDSSNEFDHLLQLHVKHRQVDEGQTHRNFQMTEERLSCKFHVADDRSSQNDLKRSEDERKFDESRNTSKKCKPRRAEVQQLTTPANSATEKEIMNRTKTSPALSRHKWMLSLKDCQERRKKRARWSSEQSEEMLSPEPHEGSSVQPEEVTKKHTQEGAESILRSEDLNMNSEATSCVKRVKQGKIQDGDRLYYKHHDSAISLSSEPLGPIHCLSNMSKESSSYKSSDFLAEHSLSSWQLSEESRCRFNSFAKVVQAISPLKSSPWKLPTLKNQTRPRGFHQKKKVRRQVLQSPGK